MAFHTDVGPFMTQLARTLPGVLTRVSAQEVNQGVWEGVLHVPRSEWVSVARFLRYHESTQMD